MGGRRPAVTSLIRDGVVLAGALALAFLTSVPALGATDSGTHFLTAKPAAFNQQVDRMVLDPSADSSLVLQTGSSVVWVSDNTYPDGLFAAADRFQVQLGWKDTPCQSPRGAPDCQISLTSGVCQADCRLIDTPAVVFPTYTFPAEPFPGGSIALAVDSPKLDLRGCPCRLYLRIQTSAPGPRSWQLRTGSASQLITPVPLSSDATSSGINYLAFHPELVVALLIGLAIVTGVVVIFLAYNRFITQRNLIRDSWADLDTELRRRYDLIPNLVQVVQGYAGYENSVLNAVAQARAAAMAAGPSPTNRRVPETAITSGLRQVLAWGESNPQLKASPAFLLLQQQLGETENRIASARRIYNNNIRDYNIRVESIPTSILAALCGFREQAYFEIDAAVRSEMRQVGSQGMNGDAHAA